MVARSLGLVSLTVLLACAGSDASDVQQSGDDLSSSFVPPPAYAEGQRLSELTPEVVEQLRTIHARSEGQDDSFVKVGDSITYSSSFLDCLRDTPVDDESLEATRLFFTPSAWDRRSLASTVGWHVTSPLVGSPTPLANEIAAMKPSFAVIMLGTNDTWDGVQRSYQRNLTKLVTTLTSQGVVPILSTIPPLRNRTQDAVVPSMNAIVRQVAAENLVPLMDFHLVLENLPKHGISGDGIHPFAAAAGACDFSEQGLLAGYNQRNELTLQALDAVRRAVLGDDAASVPDGDEPDDSDAGADDAP